MSYFVVIFERDNYLRYQIDFGYDIEGAMAFRDKHKEQAKALGLTPSVFSGEPNRFVPCVDANRYKGIENPFDLDKEFYSGEILRMLLDIQDECSSDFWKLGEKCWNTNRTYLDILKSYGHPKTWLI